MVKRKTQLFNFLSVWQLLQSHQTLTLQQRQCSVFQAFVSCGLVGSKELSVVSSVTCGDMWREAPWSKCEEVLFLWSHLVLGLWSDFEEQRKNCQLHITWCNKHISSFYLNISFLMFSKDKVFSYHALFPVLHSTTQIRSMCEPVVRPRPHNTKAKLEQEFHWRRSRRSSQPCYLIHPLMKHPQTHARWASRRHLVDNNGIITSSTVCSMFIFLTFFFLFFFFVWCWVKRRWKLPRTSIVSLKKKKKRNLKDIFYQNDQTFHWDRTFEKPAETPSFHSSSALYGLRLRKSVFRSGLVVTAAVVAPAITPKEHF